MEMEGTEIPSHFLCPISLQLMTDPVTLSTGITYDRRSIEKWLFSCNRLTCPVTKQPIADFDLTPNLTLRRLIQSWCSLHASDGIEPIPTLKPPVDGTQIVKLLEDARRLPENRLDCLRRLKSIALESDRNRGCLEKVNAVEFLCSVIADGSGSDESSSESLAILHHQKISEKCLKIVIRNAEFEIVEALVRVLRSGDSQSRAYATILLKSIFQVSDPIRLIRVDPALFVEVVRVLKDQISPQSTKAALKLLAEICPWGRNRVKAANVGAVAVLLELLMEMRERRPAELMLIVLDQVCGCAEGRAELVSHGAGLAVVSKKILRVSHVASYRAVRILSSICQFSATARVLQEMLEVGVVSKLCLVLQVDCSLKCKERAREILRLHARVWRSSPCIPSHLLSSYPSS